MEIVGPANTAELDEVKRWVRLRDLLGQQDVFDCHHMQKRLSRTERQGRLPVLMLWIDGRLPDRFRSRGAGVNAATDDRLRFHYLGIAERQWSTYIAGQDTVVRKKYL